MTIKDLILSGLIKDQDKIRVYKHEKDFYSYSSTGDVDTYIRMVAAGPWYCDRILEFRESDITDLTYVKESNGNWHIHI